MHLLVVFTGGTIGSRKTAGWLSPDNACSHILLDEFFKKEGETNVRFSTLSPYAILSENLSAQELTSLVDCLERESEKGYDGILVTHGTDTLQFSAAALDFCLTKRVPVVLVSAAYPLEDKRSNGLDNFRAAVRFLENRPQPGVYVSYKNQAAKKTDIHLATRLLSHAEGSADLHSFGGSFVRLSPQKKTNTPPMPPIQPVHGVGKVDFCPAPRILSIDCAPEKIYPQDVENYHAILLAPYHSGTLNTQSENFISFCRAAQKAEVPIFVSDLFSQGKYESKKAYESLGISPLPMTKTALFVKCWIALSLGKIGDELRDFILRPTVNEFLK